MKGTRARSTRFGIGVGLALGLDDVLLPADAGHHEAAVLFLLLRPALDDHHIDVLEQHGAARHVQLLRVGLDLELFAVHQRTCSLSVSVSLSFQVGPGQT